MDGWRLILGGVVGAGMFAFVAGALLYHRRWVRTGGVLMGLALLGVAAGAAAVVKGAASGPPTPGPIAAEDFASACARRHFFTDAEAVCACAADAYASTRAEHASLGYREVGSELVVEGPRAGQLAFHDRFAECAVPRVDRWVTAECRAHCTPQATGCPSRCVCVGRTVREARSASRIAYMFFPEPGPAPADNLERATATATEACRPDDDPPPDRAVAPIPDGNN